MTRALPQALKRTQCDLSEAKPTRRQKNMERALQIRSLREKKIQDAILNYVDLHREEVIYATTLDQLIFDLLSTGIIGSLLRGESIRSINGAFRELQDILLKGIPNLTLHIEAGNVMLGFKFPYWPMAPFTLYSDDGVPAIPEKMLRGCLRGRHTVHEY